MSVWVRHHIHVSTLLSTLCILLLASSSHSHIEHRTKRQTETETGYGIKPDILTQDRFWDKYGPVLLEALAEDGDPSEEEDSDPELSKRYLGNSYRLFSPFHHPRRSSSKYFANSEPSPSAVKRRRQPRSYTALIAKLLRLRGYKTPRRLSFVRYGPGR